MHLTRAVVWARASASQGHSPVSGAGPAGFCGLAETAAGCCFGCGASASRLPGRQEDRGQYHKELKCDMGLLQRNGIQLLPAGHTGGEHLPLLFLPACSCCASSRAAWMMRYLPFTPCRGAFSHLSLRPWIVWCRCPWSAGGGGWGVPPAC